MASISKFYRQIIPKKTRDLIYDRFLGDILIFKRNFKENIKAKNAYWFSGKVKSDATKAYAFMGKHGLTPYPGEYQLKYKDLDVQVLNDEHSNLNYVIHNDRKLYFSSKMNRNNIKSLYKALVIEQDKDSPHCYVENYSDLSNRILLDVGSAEGIFSLDVIDIVDHIFLFECEKHWISALNATFEPWKHKVTIIEKYVTDVESATEITLDSFRAELEGEKLFIKMDIEGAEMKALQGGKQLVSGTKNLSASICTYHKIDDPSNISSFFQNLGYETFFTSGFLYWKKRLNTAMLRATKSN